MQLTIENILHLQHIVLQITDHFYYMLIHYIHDITLLIIILLPRITKAQIIRNHGYLITNDRNKEYNKNGSTGSYKKVE